MRRSMLPLPRKKVAATDEWGGNALVGEALHGLAYFHGLEAFVLGHLRSMDVPWGLWLLALFGMGIGNFALLYNACLALSLLPDPASRIHASESYTAISGGCVQGCSGYDDPVSLHLSPAARATGAVGVGDCESVARRWKKTITSVVDALPPVEQINGDVNCSGDSQIDADEHRCLYRQGTVEQIENARAEAASSVGAAADQLRGEVDAAFARLEIDAVNEYLDWYYSLTGEYGRIIDAANRRNKSPGRVSD